MLYIYIFIYVCHIYNIYIDIMYIYIYIIYMIYIYIIYISAINVINCAKSSLQQTWRMVKAIFEMKL